MSEAENQEKAVPMRPSRVGVIAIHGVADPKPGSTARRVAGLLASYRPGNGDFTYQAPTEVRIRYRSKSECGRPFRLM